jgi:3-phosphoshikimate 1-carboxyvinyltransferase
MEGRLQPGEYELPGNISSQYITGLLLALPLLEGNSKIRLTSVLESAPYAQMTLDVLASFDVRAVRTEEGFEVPGGQGFRSPGRYTVEGDWSQAAFWAAANALGSQVEVEGLNGQSAQGDRAILEMLPRVLAGNCELDLSDCPDLAPILCVAAALSPGNARITGVERLRLKESDRILCTVRCLRAIGAKIKETDFGLFIEGQKSLSGGEAECFGDHRLAMALAVAALRCEEAVTIVGAEAVNKSYPHFFEDFRSLGGKADAL